MESGPIVSCIHCPRLFHTSCHEKPMDIWSPHFNAIQWHFANCTQRRPSSQIAVARMVRTPSQTMKTHPNKRQRCNSNEANQRTSQDPITFAQWQQATSEQGSGPLTGYPWLESMVKEMARHIQVFAREEDYRHQNLVSKRRQSYDVGRTLT